MSEPNIRDTMMAVLEKRKESGLQECEYLRNNLQPKVESAVQGILHVFEYGLWLKWKHEERY